jgi:hypothetical protein
MKHNSLVLLKAAVAVLLMYGFLSSCAATHSGCTGICSNKGKSAGKYYSISKNSNPKNWKR